MWEDKILNKISIKEKLDFQIKGDLMWPLMLAFI